MIDYSPAITPDHLVRTITAQLRMVADAWLAWGADEFGLYDLDGRPLWHVKTSASPGDMHEVFAVPFPATGNPFGTLRLALSRHEYTALVEQRLRADVALLASQLQIETDMENMTFELIDAQDQQLAFFKLARSVRDTTDLNSTMTMLAQEATRLLKAEAGFLILLEGDTPHIAQYPEARLPDPDIYALFDTVHRTKSEQRLSSSEIPGIDNLVLIPIYLRETVGAGLGMVNKPGGFASPDLKLARAVAEIAGTHLEKVMLHEEALQQERYKAELNMAATIQSQLLPQSIPVIDGIDIHGRLRQAQLVGGDMYIFAGSPERFIFAVGDVAGKGVSGALMMGITRTIIQSQASTTPQPDQILTAVNMQLYDDYTRVNMFTTMFIGCYDTTTRQVCYCNGGHSPVIYHPAEGPAEMLRATDIPIGVLPDHLYTSRTLTLNPGDVLVVATDGFSEAQNNHDELFGYTRLLALVERHARRGARTIAELMLATVNTFSAGHAQDDDQTIVVIKGIPAREETLS